MTNAHVVAGVANPAVLVARHRPRLAGAGRLPRPAGRCRGPRRARAVRAGAGVLRPGPARRPGGGRRLPRRWPAHRVRGAGARANLARAAPTSTARQRHRATSSPSAGRRALGQLRRPAARPGRPGLRRRVRVRRSTTRTPGTRLTADEVATAARTGAAADTPVGTGSCATR